MTAVEAGEEAADRGSDTGESGFLSIRGARKAFRGTKGQVTAIALDGVDLDIAAGEVVVLIGPSGSGKSTLLRAVNRLEKLDDGEISIGGARVTDPHVDIRSIRERAGMVFQHFNLFPHLSVIENVALAPRIVRKIGGEEARARSEKLLHRVGLADKLEAHPRELSGGQQQRAAIARALAMEPELLLVDEPTSALDPEMVREVLDVLTTVAREGMTMFIVSHEMGFARAAADSVAFMDAGRIIEIAPPCQLFDSPREERTRAFLSRVL